MYTLNNIVKELQNFQANHKFLKSFTFGDTFEFEPGKTGFYYAMTATLQPSELLEEEENFTFEFGFYGKVNLDRSNEVEVLSDTRQMAKDLIAYIRMAEGMSDLNLKLPITLNDRIDAFDPGVSGTFFTASLSQFIDLNLCGLPIDGGDQDNAYLTESGEDFMTESGETLILE